MSLSYTSCGDDEDDAGHAKTPSDLFEDDSYGKKDSLNVSGQVNGHDYVDLALPSGVKWATCNVGASSPLQFGDYYAWSEIDTKEVYDSATYKWMVKVGEEPCKYSSDYERHNRAGYDVIIDPSDDVAFVKWGRMWCMPTFIDMQELFNGCDWQWVENYNGSGVNGAIGISKYNGKRIFFPYGGWRYGSQLYSVGNMGGYWSSSHDGLVSFYAHCFRFYHNRWNVEYLYTKEYGLSVRAVSK